MKKTRLRLTKNEEWHIPIIVKNYDFYKFRKVKILTADDVQKIKTRYNDGENIYIKYRNEIKTIDHFMKHCGYDAIKRGQNYFKTLKAFKKRKNE